MSKWTKEQSEVITHRKGNLLVSAAAGSGKTAVLVEHVIDRLLDKEHPISLSSVVLMTFTEAAASEMKERIKARLKEAFLENRDPHIEREIAELPNANISTIDAFCKRLIQENYTSLGIEPNFRIGEGNELALLKEDIVEDLLEEEYSKKEENFLSFVDRFSSGKEDKGIQEIILKLHRLAIANPFPERYLKELLEDGGETWKSYLLESIKKRAEEALKTLQEAMQICGEEGGPSEYLVTVKEDYQSLFKLKALWTPEDDEENTGETTVLLHRAIEGIQAISFNRIKNSKADRKAEVKGRRDAVKALIQDWQKSYTLIPKEIEEKADKEEKILLKEAIRLALLFLERYQEEKLDRNILDFSDLEHFALRLLYTEKDGKLSFTALADELAKEYTEILVDEYQDSNMVQEYLVSALSKERFSEGKEEGNVFQVGDVKQSIYRFRMARPELFLQKYYDKDYPKILLQKNFRSLKGVIDAVNTCFFRIMKKDLGGIEYDRDSSLFQGREEKEGVDSQTELLLMEKEENKPEKKKGEQTEGKQKEEEKQGEKNGGTGLEKESDLQLECRMIASRVKEFHKKNIDYKDMVILLRSPKKVAKDMVDIFSEEGIPSFAVSSDGYYSSVEVETVLAMLSVIDNPKQDIPLAAVLHSAMFDFTDEELCKLKIAYGSLGEALCSFSEDIFSENICSENSCSEIENPLQVKSSLDQALFEKWKNFCEKLERYRRLSRNLRVHELLYLIYEETSYYLYVSVLPMGEKRRANLDQLIEDALQFEKGSFSGLFNFIRYIEKAKQKEYDEGEANVYSENDNLLRIMSIHQSKGLQFKVVFLSSIQKGFNKQDLRESILLDEKLGMASQYVDPETRIKYPSLQLTAIKEKIEEENQAEELRLLYVAMTRAEEKLVMTGVVKNLSYYMEKHPVKDDLSLEDLRNANSYFDFMMLGFSRSLSQNLETPIVKLKLYNKQDLSGIKKEEKVEKFSLRDELYSFLKKKREKTLEEEEWDKDFSYRYPHEESTHLYPKYAVSLIKEQAIEALKEQEKTAEDFRIFREDDTETVDTGNTGEAVNSMERLQFPKRKKEKREKGLGAKIGDSFHHALALFDYTKGLEQLPAILGEEELSLLNKEQFQTFLSSSLGECFKKAYREKRLFREKHFMRALPYHSLFPERAEKDEVLLQGIIDAFIVEDDGIILVDYKTDRVKSEEELRERYQKQIMLYSDALEAILGKKVKKRVLYSFYLGEEVEILP
mgnify:CR=1 FL=1|nr:helicase-exonuclease AddAB subunit AddA [uncultured Oribacterium sp.]